MRGLSIELAMLLARVIFWIGTLSHVVRDVAGDVSQGQQILRSEWLLVAAAPNVMFFSGYYLGKWVK